MRILSAGLAVFALSGCGPNEESIKDECRDIYLDYQAAIHEADEETLKRCLGALPWLQL